MLRYLQDGFRISERRACGLIQFSRTSHRHQSTRTDDPVLPRRLRELAAARPRFGYRRLCVLRGRDALGSEGGVVSVRILDRTVLADELGHHGFVARRPDRERTYRIGLARDDGPAQDALAEVHRWNLFSGFNDV